MNNINLFRLSKLLFERNLVISTAESATGGLLSSRLTDISGSSEYTKLNLVTYSNEAKQKNLGVSAETLAMHGAVSEECAREMAEGLMNATGCDVAVCTTGIAGPTGGSENKPVGTLYVSVKYHDVVTVRKYEINHKLSRVEMKEKFTELALELTLNVLLGL